MVPNERVHELTLLILVDVLVPDLHALLLWELAEENLQHTYSGTAALRHLGMRLLGYL